jgi:hypothetical protein
VNSPLPDLLAEAQRLHARVLAASRARRQSHHALATLLYEVFETATFRTLGYARLADYAADALGLERREVRDLLWLGKRLRELPDIDAALASGDLDPTKARDIARVADRHSAAAWVEFALQATSREIEQRIRKAAPGDTPDEAATREDDTRGARVRLVIECEAPDAAVIASAMAAVRAQCVDPIDDGAALAMIARHSLEAPQKQEKPLSGEPYRVVLRHCPECERTTTVDGEVVSDTIASEAACDCEVIDLLPGPHLGHLTRAIPETLRRRVLDRDDWKCAVPHCRNRHWIDVHHLIHRAHGGRHEYDNLITLCTCHHRMLHEGLIAIERRRDGKVEVRTPLTGAFTEWSVSMLPGSTY